MAQYGKHNNKFLQNGTSIFEVVMIADAEGNINGGGGNFTGPAVDAFGRARVSHFEYGLFLNATPSTSFTWTSFSSAIDYSLQGLGFSDLGTRVGGGYLGGKTAPITLSDGAFNWDYQLGSTIDGVSDTLTLAVRTSTASAKAGGILKWFEI